MANLAGNVRLSGVVCLASGQWESSTWTIGISSAWRQDTGFVLDFGRHGHGLFFPRASIKSKLKSRDNDRSKYLYLEKRGVYIPVSVDISLSR